MKHQPLTKQRSRWEQDGWMAPRIGIWKRLVSDGMLAAIVATPWSEEKEWHMSISFRDQKSQHSRYPSWDEIMHARMELIPLDVAMHMIIPPLDGDDYVAVHPTTFHLHQYHEYGKEEPNEGEDNGHG